ncbi:vWA domain-containing protein [Filifactor alocis]
MKTMKRDVTELVFILDESGSMQPLTTDTIGGFNSMLAKQKNETGNALVTTVFFHNDSKIVHDRIDIKKVEPLTDKEYVPGGCTALIDALGDTITHIEKIHKYIKAEDVPGKTLFIISTDGEENASHKYTSDEIKQKIRHLQKHKNWDFIFLGANLDAVATAKSYGIEEENAVTFLNDKKGVKLNYKVLESAISNYRNNNKLCANWKEEIEADVKSRE